MPELPELEVVREVLQSRVVAQHIGRVELVQPAAALVVRDLLGRGFSETLTGARVDAVKRRGKFLILEFSNPASAVTGAPDVFLLAINPKLTGRLQLAATADKRHKKTAFVATLFDGTELRYYDDKTMGQLYLTDDVQRLPDFAGMGPEPFDLTLDQFVARLRSYRGEVKGILMRGDFIAGIGNAYADEILWHAKLHPFRKRNELTPDETARLYHAMTTTLSESIALVRVEMGDKIHLKPRDFFAVHMRAGEPCPRCGTSISEVSANQRITNFCRTCQPGGLIRGM